MEVSEDSTGEEEEVLRIVEETDIHPNHTTGLYIVSSRPIYTPPTPQVCIVSSTHHHIIGPYKFILSVKSTNIIQCYTFFIVQCSMLNNEKKKK